MGKKRRPDLISFCFFYSHLPFLSQTIIMVLKKKHNKVKTFKFFLMSLCIYISKYIHIFNKG